VLHGEIGKSRCWARVPGEGRGWAQVLPAIDYTRLVLFVKDII